MKTKLQMFVSSIVDSSTTAILKAIPDEYSPEKKFINSIAGELALMVMADGIIDEDETVNAVSFLMKLEPVMNLSMQSESAVMYEAHINNLEGSLAKSKTEFIVEKAKIIGAVKQSASYSQEYKTSLLNVLELVTSGGGADADEIQMKNDIMEVLK